MNQSTIAEVVHLPWDSEFFGFQVGRFDIREADLVLAENALAKAKEDGFRLIYLSVDSGNPELSHEYSGVFGKAIDLKTTFICKLEGSLVDQQILKFAAEDGVYLMEKEAGPAGIDLEKLAILSGTESRFFKDPKIPIGKAHEMYRIWINKCTERELADSVFVACSPARDIIGFITVKHEIDISSIGLFAVNQQWQGRKIGSRLLQAAAQNAIGRNNSKITVATQGSNVGASLAYLKNGYTVHSNQYLFHMWFQ